MDPDNLPRLAIITFAIVGIAYACIGTGVFSKGDWWNDLPQNKKIVFGTALAATLLQTFL